MTEDKKSEIVAYIYQNIETIEQFLTEESEVSFVEVSPKKVRKKLLELGQIDEDFPKYRFCYKFLVKNQDSKIESYGFGDNHFEAIKSASDKMFKIMTDLCEKVVSTKDHNNRIETVLNGNSTIH